MLTPQELDTLESLLLRARALAGADRAAIAATLAPGDLVQLRPGADPFWQTSLVLVELVRDDGGISGPLLRPHRSGCREAWYTFRPPDLARIGRAPFPAPDASVRSQVYNPPCPICHDCRRKPIDQARAL